MKGPLALLLACALAPGACKTPTHDATPSATPAPTAELTDPSFSNMSRAGTYLISWRPVGGPVPLNEPFELEVHVERRDGEAATPVSGAQVYVDASMPEHNHGMLREPRAHEVEPGVYRVEGMLLHMTGYWQVFVNIVQDGLAETADFELTLE